MAEPERPELDSLRRRLDGQWGDDPDSAKRVSEAIAVVALWWAELRAERWSRLLSVWQAHRLTGTESVSQLKARIRDERVDLRTELKTVYRELERAYEEMDRLIGWKDDDDV
jgi:hypothetical protein